MQSVVFNGNYLNYFDVAFTDYWRETRLPDAEMQFKKKLELFVRKVEIQYYYPAHFDEILEIGVRCDKLGNTSLNFCIEIYNQKKLIVSGDILYVFVNSKLHLSKKIPKKWREKLINFEQNKNVKI